MYIIVTKAILTRTSHTQIFIGTLFAGTVRQLPASADDVRTQKGEHL